MKKLPWRPIGLLLAVGLAGCTASAGPQFKDAHDVKEFISTTSSGVQKRTAFERFATMATFPTGETAGMLFMREVDPVTGQQLNGEPGSWYAYYAFNGETMARVTVRGITQSIIPALTSGLAGIKIAEIGANGNGNGTVILNSVGASIDSNVGIEIDN